MRMSSHTHYIHMQYTLNYCAASYEYNEYSLQKIHLIICFLNKRRRRGSEENIPN